MKERGRVTRGWLGVTIQDVDKNLAESFGLDRPEGALVAEVSPDSPAQRAGLQNGDIITRFDGKEIPTSSSLPHVVGLIAPGTEVEVELVRNKVRKTRTVEVGGLDADESYTLAARKTDGDGGDRLGLVVETVPAENLERYGINGGVVVRKVESGSAAADAGIRVGDVITLIDTRPIKSTAAFEKAVDGLKGGTSVPLRLIRQGAPLFIGLKVPD